VKCGQSKDDNIAPTCGCGGSYKTSMNRGELRTRLRMIKSGEQLRSGLGVFESLQCTTNIQCASTMR
jgi:hypothetical protein